MLRRPPLLALLVMPLAAHALPPAPAHTGRIEGTVTFAGAVPALAPLPVPAALAAGARACGGEVPDDALRVHPTNHGVRYAVVALVDVPPASAPAAPAPVVSVEQQRCAFTPHVVATTVGAAVRFGNRDPGVLHNVHGYYGLTGDEAMFNVATPAGIAVTRTIDRPGIHRVVCDAGHTWMALYLHAFEHPYFAVTDENGRFAIPNVPPGSYRLRVWHEGWSRGAVDAHGRVSRGAAVETEQRVTVAPDGRLIADAELTAAPALALHVRSAGR